MCNLMSKKPPEGICHLTLERTTVLKWEFLQEYLHKHRLNTSLAFAFPRLEENAAFQTRCSRCSDSELLTCPHAFRTDVQCVYQVFISDMQCVHHTY